MSIFTILVDNREQKPYIFDDYPVETEHVTLETGDYALKGDGWRNENDTFIPRFSVERKGESDFLNSITWERDRFKREIRRADNWDNPMPIMVESPWSKFQMENYYPNVSFASIEGTVESWVDLFNAEFFFKEDRADAERATYEFLRWRQSKD